MEQSATAGWRVGAPPDSVILAIGKCLSDVLDTSAWRELALMTGTRDKVEKHPRLLRSLSWGDDDYAGHVLEMTPSLLGEKRGVPTAGGLLARLPNLEMVSDFVNAPVWLAEHEPALYSQLCLPKFPDATLPDGTVLDAVKAATARLEVAEMRRQVERIRRDYAEDPEASVGQAKDLIETTCKTVLGMTGSASRTSDDVPALVTQTLKHLGLSAAQVPERGDKSEARARQRLFGGLSNVLQGANELRNARGTGHGRSGGGLIDSALARMTSGMVLAAVVYLCEAYAATTTPRSDLPELVGLGPAAPATADGYKVALDVAVGTVVSHVTFGRGTVLAKRGADATVQAQIEFSDQARWLLLKNAPLRYARS